MQVVTCVERRVERYLRDDAETAVEAPHLSIIYIVGALHGDAEVVDGLLFIDGVTILNHLKFGLQPTVAQPCLQCKAIIQSVL